VTVRLRAAIVALAAALLCGLLGSSVSERPPDGIDLAGRALAGHAAHVALVFTASCWWQTLVSLGVAAIVLAVAVPAWRTRVIFSLATTLVAWQASDAIKNVFARLRPEYWTLHHETSASYPSGHAMFAVVVYGLWSYYIATSNLAQPLRTMLAVAVALWGIGVIWSRLALGAHYITDLIGGVLFGIMMLALATSIARGIPRLSSIHSPVIPSVVEGPL
jgi:membrane-associated phospholipid phosphatase